MEKNRIILFVGSTKESRLGDRVSIFVKKALEDAGFEVEVFDPVELKFDMLHKCYHHYDNPDDAPELLRNCADKINKADGYIAISPEYNNCIPPALTNMLNHFPAAMYAWKPSGIVCYSLDLYGGIRAGAQLRQMLGYLGCASVQYCVALPKAHEQLNEDGTSNTDYVGSEVGKMIKQFTWHVNSTKNHRAKVGVPTI